ncbi:hypothetical protein P9152_00850 [Bacillus subtilis]|uniref:hypothetical protein n=1 Tax=Bacillus subtilis TaxID=1423 RepID=UPI002282202C|nr:hypothetical protein [Bacillus subtilis]MCY9367674.1 hypothetical protein [Bacillus spizizenii]MEC3621534.1 hypothetical protein [Bacillus subtilis]MEC3633381.1 hypothetical protein [Bacillus subtilis]MEC3643873.1 hypothetical protein [Bacillus subtilis]MEC3648868.1 hypothetical protein [Bacillus subtilis]
MIKEFIYPKNRWSYIEGLQMVETETGLSFTACNYTESKFDKAFNMEPVEFDILTESDRNVGYGLHMVYAKAKGVMEYKLFRMVADADGYFFDYVDSTEYMLMKQILRLSVSPDGERTGEFYLYPKGE